MKLQCDVCSKNEASVFCIADEAVLCDACDHRVHYANKLASKHQRFSLLHSSSKDFPLCDVCQEKRAFLFCQQDRAILCKDCDGPIHKANEHTLSHNRFLLTGVKLSASSAVYSCNSSSSTGDSISQKDQHSKKKKAVPVSTPNSNSSAEKPSITSVEKAEFNSSSSNNNNNNNNHNNNNNLVVCDGIDPASSTISEYLMETLPGWCFEDLLDFPGFCKVDEELLPMVGTDLGGTMNPFSTSNIGIWVPQAPSPLNQSQHYVQTGLGLKDGKEIINVKNNSRNWADDTFTVPQMSPPSSGSKRGRSFW